MNFLARQLGISLARAFRQVAVLRLIDPTHLLLERGGLAAEINGVLFIMVRRRLGAARSINLVGQDDCLRVDVLIAQKFLTSFYYKPIRGAMVHVALVRMR